MLSMAEAKLPMCVQPLHKAARPGTRVCGWRGSVALHPASHRLAERNRSVALRRPDSHVGRTEQHCITPRTVPEPERPLSLAPASVRPAPAAAYGLAPYAICVRLQPQLTPSLHPTPNSTGHLMDARFSVGSNFNVITRPKEVAGVLYFFFVRSRAAARLLSYVIN